MAKTVIRSQANRYKELKRIVIESDVEELVLFRQVIDDDLRVRNEMLSEALNESLNRNKE
jgi:hypothetical protein